MRIPAVFTCGGVPRLPLMISQGWPKAIVCDTSGVIADKFGLAPIICMQRAARKIGLNIPQTDILPWLGLGKRRHLMEIMQLPFYQDQFFSTHKRHFCETKDLSHFVELYEKEQLELHASTPLFTEILPEFTSMLHTLQQKNPGLVVTVTSGYTKSIMTDLLVRFAKQNFMPNATVCSSDTPLRTTMILWSLGAFKIRPEDAVFIGDQVTDIDSALKARIACIGVAHSVLKDDFQHANASVHSLLQIPNIIEKWKQTRYL